MRKINYFNERGLSLAELAIKAKTMIGYVERDLNELSEVGYTSEYYAKLKQSFNTYWNLSSDVVERSESIKATEERDQLLEELKMKMRKAIVVLRTVLKDEKESEIRIFENISFSNIRHAELIQNGKNLIQFIENNLDTLKTHPLFTEKYVEDYNIFLEKVFWAMFTANAKYKGRRVNTEARHLMAHELYKQIQTAAMFGKLAFFYDNSIKYNDYIIESTSSSGKTAEEDVGEILEFESEALNTDSDTETETVSQI